MGNIADSVRIAQDKDGMLRRALERIIQLYTDKSHFVYELLQNAEDAEATSILFVQYADRLEVFHDGKPFTSVNLQGLCDIGKSDKVNNLNQIGEFGVGFKSVFGICDTVRLYSAPEHFRNTDVGDAVSFAVEIKDFIKPEDITEEELPSSYTTRFVFPFTVGRTFSGFKNMDTLKETLSSKLQNLGITTLLFMKNLEIIEYRIETGDEPLKGEYLLDKQRINDHCMLVSAIGTAENNGGYSAKDESISYLKFSRRIERYGQRTVDIAFPVIAEHDSYQCIENRSPYVSVYFPTETESKLGFIVQGPYRTTPNRSSIPAEDWDNMNLARETAELLRDSLIELKESGKLNMSFFKAMPLNSSSFNTFKLFQPLYEIVRGLCQSTDIIPTKSGKYVRSKNAKIARQGRLATLFTDEQLTRLVDDKSDSFYRWLPTYITETNREYKPVFEYFTNVLKIEIIRPDDLRSFFANNPDFLPAQSINWLIDLYGIFESIPGAFSKSRYEINMTTAKVVKTSTGAFVAPFRREGKTYIPNVFLHTPGFSSTEINFVDPTLYEHCRHFFDDILQLQKPNEYEFFIKDINNRYENGQISVGEQHIKDIKALVKYKQREEYTEEITRIIKGMMALRCADGIMRRPYDARIFLPIGSNGINIEAYYRNTGQVVYFVDVNYYLQHEIDENMLSALGVRDSIVIDESIQNGSYNTGTRGKQPNWWTVGEFRWKLSADALKEVLKYISAHPTAKDSMLKSQTIMKLLAVNENRLCGLVRITGNTENLDNEPCEMIHILRGERMLGWDGKWLFTESGDLVAPKTITRNELSKAIYGQFRPDSCIFSLLGFRRTEADEVNELKKKVPHEQLEAFFESELKQRYGITSAYLDGQYGPLAKAESGARDEEIKPPFPTLRVKSWDALKKHAAEMLSYADPVRYEARVRSIRVSNHPREAHAYLSNMYRHEGKNRHKYSCQLCHDTISSFEATEVFPKPKVELDPVNLCLCPNCATTYRKLRDDRIIRDRVRREFVKKTEAEIEAGDFVTVPVDENHELWFTQTHFAEIRELMKLAEDVRNLGPEATTQPINKEKSDVSELSANVWYIGKTVTGKDGFVGVITNADDQLFYVHVTEGKHAGKKITIPVETLLKKQ